MIVKKWMSTPVFYLSPNAPAKDIIDFFHAHNIHRAPVLDGHKIVGIVTERDYFSLKNLHASLLVQDIMKKNVIFTGLYDSIEKAALLMHQQRIGGLPVTEDNRLAGIITRHDVLQALLEMTGALWNIPRLTLVIDDRPGSVREVADMIRQFPARIISIFTTKYQMPPDKRELIMRVDSEQMPRIIETLKSHYGEIMVHENG
jgi:acetoin utilization protein AcuB